MGLGVDTWTLATHVLRIAVLALIAWRVMTTFRSPALLAEAERRGLSAAAALACVALIIERGWAIAARGARAYGVDLLGMHPAPEFVGFLTAVGTYALCGPLLVARLGPGRAGNRIAGEWAALLLMWLAVALALR